MPAAEVLPRAAQRQALAHGHRPSPAAAPRRLAGGAGAPAHAPRLGRALRGGGQRLCGLQLPRGARQRRGGAGGGPRPVAARRAVGSRQRAADRLSGAPHSLTFMCSRAQAM
ncbi:hypothetical protein OF001_U320025 [Pseudomonas sp. OF001]|nr:hypothetical protein OF001_U320025 [Pseudomonas sp. OF001]